MATDTLQDIRETMIDRYGIGRRGTVDSGASGSTTTVKDDADFGGHSAAQGVEPGCYLRVTSGSSAPDEDVTRLATSPGRTTGEMTVDPPLSAQITANVTFEILYRPLTFTDHYAVHRAINDALLLMPEKLMVPITMLKDGDMLAEDASSWLGSGASCDKSAASFPLGLRELKVTNSAANGWVYVPSGDIVVDSSASYYLEATGRVGSAVGDATARLACYSVEDATNLTVDDDNTTQQEPEVLSSNVTTNSATERVRIRLGADEDAVVSYWSNVIFMKNGLREWLVQDRAEVDRLGGLYIARADWRNRDFTPIGGEPEQLTEGLWRYRAEYPVSGRSVWYEEFRKPAELSADADTTSIPKEHAAAVAAEILLRPLAEQDKWRDRWLVARAAAAEVLGKYRARRSYVNRAPRSYPLLVT